MMIWNPFLAVPIFTALANLAVSGFRNTKARRYNSPAAQASRFRRAGMSPNAIFTNADPGNFNPLASSDLDPNWFSHAQTQQAMIGKAQAETEGIRAEANISKLTEQILTSITDHGITVLEDQIGSAIDKDKATATGLRASAITEPFKQRALEQDVSTGKSAEGLNKANTELANSKRGEIAEQILKIQQEIRTSKAQEAFIIKNSHLTDLKSSEQERATAFLSRMEYWEIDKIEEDVKRIAREIEKSQLSGKGREDMIRSMYDENGRLSSWDVVALYMYDLFQGSGGAAIGAGAGYLIGKKKK